MQSLVKIRESICSDLDEMSLKARMDRNDIDLVAKMVDIVKDIDTIDAMQEGGYSYDSEWNPNMNSYRGRGSNRNSYRNSYGNESESYRMSRAGAMMPDVTYDERNRMR